MTSWASAILQSLFDDASSPVLVLPDVLSSPYYDDVLRFSCLHGISKKKWDIETRKYDFILKITHVSGLDGGLIVFEEFSPSLVLSLGTTTPSEFCSCKLFVITAEFGTACGLVVDISVEIDGSLGNGLSGGALNSSNIR